MKCKICNTKNSECFSAKILGKYHTNYYHCSNCDFVQTGEPYWLDEAYPRSINVSDTGYMARNVLFSHKLTILLYLLFGEQGRYLDYAGGYGVFVRLMRDVGFDYYWDDKYTKNLFAAGFEWDGKSQIDALTVFEAFEHFVHPIDEIEKLLQISNAIILSTDLHPDPVPKPEEWWYYGLDHGQHISFYSKNTFQYIAQKFGLFYYNLGSLHILSKESVALWKLSATKLSRLAFHKMITKYLRSKTWDDFKWCTEKHL